MSQNGLHKLPVVIFEMTQKSFELEHAKWPGDRFFFYQNNLHVVENKIAIR